MFTTNTLNFGLLDIVNFLNDINNNKELKMLQAK